MRRTGERGHDGGRSAPAMLPLRASARDEKRPGLRGQRDQRECEANKGRVVSVLPVRSEVQRLHMRRHTDMGRGP